MLEASEIKSKIRFSSIFYTFKLCSQSLYQAASVSAQLQHNGGLPLNIHLQLLHRQSANMHRNIKREGMDLKYYFTMHQTNSERKESEELVQKKAF